VDDWVDWEPAEELLAYAKAAGFSVSRTQLVRWHKRGLIPRPRLRYIQGRRGAQTLYPPGTSKPLLAVCELEAIRRPLDHVGWELFWDGHERDMTEIRSFIRSICDDFESTQAKLRLAVRTGKALPGSRWKVRDYLTTSTDLDKPLGTIRRRLNWRGRNEFGRFVDLLLQALVGKEPQIRPGDADIVDRAFRFDEGRRVPLHGSTEWLPPQDGAAFKWMAKFVSRPLREVLDEASDSDLIAARDDARALANFIVSFGEIMEWAFGRAGLGFGFLGRVMDRFLQDPKRQAFIVLQLYALRMDPDLGTNVRDFRVTADDWNDSGYPAWRRLRLIADELPAAQAVVGEARIREAFKSPRGWENLVGEVEVFRTEHSAEIDAIISAHPEVFPAVSHEDLSQPEGE